MRENGGFTGACLAGTGLCCGKLVKRHKPPVSGRSLVTAGGVVISVVLDEVKEPLDEGGEGRIVEVEVEAGELGDGLVARLGQLLPEGGQHWGFALRWHIEGELPGEAG